MKNTVHLQFGWHSHVPYVLNNHNYYRENRREGCAKWIFDSVAGFTEYFKIFDEVEAFSSFLSISGQAVEQFAALAEMDAHLRNYLLALNYKNSYLDQIKQQSISLLDKTRHYAGSGRLELIGTGFNHPIMPFLTEDHVLEEIERSRRMMRDYFGVATVQGFFPPESCISSRDIDLYARSGLKYLVLEDPAYMEVGRPFTRASNNNAYLLTETDAALPLYCFNRNRPVSLLSWLSDHEESSFRDGAASNSRSDIRYQQLDHSVERTKAEFASIFGDAKHQSKNHTNAAQFANLIHGLIARHMHDSCGEQPSGIMLFTDHEYLGAGAAVFPRMHEAVRLLAHERRGDCQVNFSTLRQYHELVEQTRAIANIQVKQGSWCTGLMLSDGLVAAREDGIKLYSHGTLAAPFANWRSFSFHYQLARAHYRAVRDAAVAANAAPAIHRTLDQLAGLLDVACTSCFYGWFPPVYRMIPAWELYKQIHEGLSTMTRTFGSPVDLAALAWDDNALAALRGRIVQFKLGVDADHTCVKRIELSILCARNIFYLHQTEFAHQAYQFLINAAKELDDLFEEANYNGVLFQEPNDPWDLWKRELVEGEYV